MYQIKSNLALSVIYAVFLEDASSSQIKEMLQDIEHLRNLPRQLKLITDYRYVIDVEYDMQGFHRLAEYVNTSFKHKFDRIHWVSVTNLPSHTASALYFSQLIDDQNIEYRYVTDIESALERLKLPEFESLELEGLISKGGEKKNSNRK